MCYRSRTKRERILHKSEMEDLQDHLEGYECLLKDELVGCVVSCCVDAC